MKTAWKREVKPTPPATQSAPTLLKPDQPGVPGWGSQAPVMREGALDYKRHQYPASRIFTAGQS